MSDPTEPTTPTEPETQPTEPETQPTVPETQPTEPETQPSEPDGGDVMPEQPDLSEIETTIETIESLNPDNYTAESYAALLEAVEAVEAILNEGGYTQETIDEANAMLAEAMANLVLADDDTTDDDDQPADTGDIALSILTGLTTLAAVGGAVVIGKKKFF